MSPSGGLSLFCHPVLAFRLRKSLYLFELVLLQGCEIRLDGMRRWLEVLPLGPRTQMSLVAPAARLMLFVFAPLVWQPSSRPELRVLRLKASPRVVVQPHPLLPIGCRSVPTDGANLILSESGVKGRWARGASCGVLECSGEPATKPSREGCPGDGPPTLKLGEG